MIKTKILRYLIDNNKGINIRQLSKELEIDYKLIHTNITNLEKLNLLEIRKIGRSRQIFFNYNYNYLVQKVEDIKKNEVLKKKNIAVLNKRINELKNPFFILIIFGSYANKKQTKSSDIDICVISDENKEVIEVLETFPNLHVNNFTYSEFNKMLTTTKNNIAKEIINNRVILRGVENFYSMIQNAR